MIILFLSGLIFGVFGIVFEKTDGGISMLFYCFSIAILLTTITVVVERHRKASQKVKEDNF